MARRSVARNGRVKLRLDNTTLYNRFRKGCLPQNRIPVGTRSDGLFSLVQTIVRRFKHPTVRERLRPALELLLGAPSRSGAEPGAAGESRAGCIRSAAKLCRSGIIRAYSSGNRSLLGSPQRHDWHHPRALPDRGTAREGWNGRGLSRRRHAAAAASRAQDARPRARRATPIAANGSSARRAPPPRSTIPTSSPSTRSRKSDGIPFLTLELIDGQTLADADSRRRLAARSGADPGDPAGRRRRRRAPAWHHPSRSQAGQHDGHERRPREGARLRAGKAEGRCPPGRRGRHADRRAHWRRAASSAPSPTCRRSRRKESPSISARTSSRSASCSTRWRPATTVHGRDADVDPLGDH